MPLYTMVIPVEEFDTDLLPPDARDGESSDFDPAVQRYLEEELSSIGGEAVVRVSEGCVTVRWESDCDFRELGKASVRRLESGEVQEALQLLRLWVTGYEKNATIRYSIALPLIGFGSDYQRRGERMHAADCWFDAAHHIALALEDERANLAFRKECTEALLRCCRLLRKHYYWHEAASSLESLVLCEPECEEAWVMLAEVTSIIGEVQEASFVMSEVTEPAQPANCSGKE